jgi:hypothetical protein
MKRLPLLGLISITILAAASCGASLNRDLGSAVRHQVSEIPGLGWIEPVTEIAAIQTLEASREVILEGRVEQSLPLIEQGLYRLSDETGSIWVVSAHSPPAVGEPLKIRAAVRYESILMAGQDVGEHYAAELDRYPLE